MKLIFTQTNMSHCPIQVRTYALNCLNSKHHVILKSASTFCSDGVGPTRHGVEKFDPLDKNAQLTDRLLKDNIYLAYKSIPYFTPFPYLIIQFKFSTCYIYYSTVYDMYQFFIQEAKSKFSVEK